MFLSPHLHQNYLHPHAPLTTPKNSDTIYKIFNNNLFLLSMDYYIFDGEMGN